MDNKHTGLLIDNLALLKCDDPERSQFILNTLVVSEYERLGAQAGEQKPGSGVSRLGMMSVRSDAKKQAHLQREVLEGLRGKDGQFVDSAALRDLLDKTKKNHTKGRVITLLKTILAFQTTKESLAATSAKNEEKTPESP